VRFAIMDNDFDKFLESLRLSLKIPDYAYFDELDTVIKKYSNANGLAAAICAIVHTWCEEHNTDPEEFFNIMATIVSQQVAEEKEGNYGA
jgi:hypothetical protein